MVKLESMEEVIQIANDVAILHQGHTPSELGMSFYDMRLCFINNITKKLRDGGG